MEIEYRRHYQIIEPESLQNNNIKYVRYNIKSMYPERKFSSILNKHAEIFVPHTVECEFKNDFGCEEKDKPRNESISRN